MSIVHCCVSLCPTFRVQCCVIIKERFRMSVARQLLFAILPGIVCGLLAVWNLFILLNAACSDWFFLKRVVHEGGTTE